MPDLLPDDPAFGQALLDTAVAQARDLAGARGWTPPSGAALQEALQLLAWLRGRPVPEVAVQPSGAVAVEWDVAGRGWLRFEVDGSGRLRHEAVVDGDDFAQDEPLAARPEGWARAVLDRLLPAGGQTLH